MILALSMSKKMGNKRSKRLSSLPPGKSLYNAYRGAMAYIEVRLPNGDVSIGTAFHVGEGIFITAKHVVEGNAIIFMATTEGFAVPDEDGLMTIHGDPQRYSTVSPQVLTVVAGPFFHPDKGIDVAAVVVRETNMKVVTLGGHLDDWINDSQFIMVETIVMGYPPIPFSEGPILVTARGEINGVLDRRDSRHPHFLISAMARGGFSGGLCLIEWGFALGVITESLVTNDQAPELGFMAVISIEPIFVCLQHHQILPAVQKQGWDGLWDRNTDDPVQINDAPFEVGKPQF